MSKKRVREDEPGDSIVGLIPRLKSMPLKLSALALPVRKALRAAQAALESAAESPKSAAVRRAKSAADAARESTFPYIEGGDPEYNGAYAAAGLQYAAALLAEARLPASKAAARKEAATSALRALDLSMLRGGVDEWGAASEPLVRAAHQILAEGSAHEPPPSAHSDMPADVAAHRKRMEQACPHFVAGEAKAEATAIPRVDARTITLAEFQEQYMRSSPAPTPVILTHAIDGWPAVSASSGHRWSMEYLRRMAGGRLVPVETYAEGDATSTYLSESWDRKVIPLADYIDQYVFGQGSADSTEEGGPSSGGGERGYLAQHPLFDQIPMLRDDIHIAEFCKARSEADDAAPDVCEVREVPIISAWFGPAGTVSPLHNDPFHNLLAQVVGTKYVRLIDAKWTPRLYPRCGALCNNSHVNLDKPSPAKHPLFEGTPFWHAVLAPSELLYIPRLCWHYVRSLEVSMSVSFWWGARMALTVDDDGTVEETY